MRQARPRPHRASVAARRSESARHRDRRSSIWRRSRSAARYSLSSVRWYSTRRVAWPMKTGSTPAANGSRVPPWPDALTPVSRRISATMSCEVGPGSLATTRMPSICGRAALSASLRGGPQPPSASNMRRAASSTRGTALLDRLLAASRPPLAHGRRRRTPWSASWRPARRRASER